MRVRQNYGIDVAGWNGSVFPVAQPPLLGALKKTAVHQHLHAGLVGNVIPRIDEVFRSGDGSGSAQKLKVGHNILFCSSFLKRTISQESGGKRKRRSLA